MCGIAGVIAKEPVDPARVVRMRDQLAHRGPDHAGLWSNTSGQVCLGHRRLAIVDLTPEANQPLISSDGRYVITFNGEIYNYRELRATLKAEGVEFRTQSDTEVLLEAFRRWGHSSLERLSGMFAFAIWDTRERKLFCARDRAGEKPFYYAALDRAFLFGSEIKALTAWPEFPRKLHLPAVIDYLSMGFIPDPKSIWEGCAKLPPGHYLWVSVEPDGRPVVGTPTAYWDWTFAPDTGERNWGELIRENLAAAAQEMLVADVPAGTFLSGGVDSSGVTAALSRGGQTVKTFTVGFEEAAFDERPYAAIVSQHCRTEHTARTVVASDVAQVWEKLMWHYDEPFNDYSYLPTYYVCREARRTITVALSGDGSDEVFGGYSKYKRLALRDQVNQWIPGPLLTATARTAAGWLPASHRLQKNLAGYQLDTTGALASTLSTVFPDGAVRAAARGALAAELGHYQHRDAIEAVIAKAPPQQVGLLNAMRYLDLKMTLAGDMLVKVDRASMAVALEVRPVFLHHRILELAARLPADQLADRHQAKKALKSALRPWLPDSILYRPKMGFATPLNKWMKGELRELFEDRRPGALEELVDVKALEQVAQQEQGAALQQHSLFFLRNWLRRNVSPDKD